MNVETSSLLARLSKKDKEKVKLLEYENGLIDNCKFMLYFSDSWNYGECSSYPVRSITEAVKVVRQATNRD